MTDTAPVAAMGETQPAHTSRRTRNWQQDRAAFYLTGRQEDTQLAQVEGLGLRSALLAPYRGLTGLRYDFPLLLADGAPAPQAVQTLSGLFDDLLELVATGDDAERLRHHARQLETEIRHRSEAGPARLAQLWAEGVDALQLLDPDMVADLDRLTAARFTDGELIPCAQDSARHVVEHVWTLVQQARVEHLSARIARLRQGLEDILAAEEANSPAGLTPERLSHSVGPVFGGELDVTALARLLTENRPRFSLTDSRRARVQRLRDVLVAQRFVRADEPGLGGPEAGTGGSPATGEADLYEFVYLTPHEAIEAYHDRFAATTELAKALVIAELEVDGRYREETHDALFETWSVADLDAETLAIFPEYLVCVEAEQLSADDSVALLEALAAGLPIKILVVVNDLLERAPTLRRGPESGLSASMLSSAALSDGEAFVLQVAASGLHGVRQQLAQGCRVPGAALFLVYSGAGSWPADLPLYLAAATAVESRVFPTFTYDPSAGETWADRFSLAGNPQPEADWPVRVLRSQDDALQTVRTDVPFTAADFFAGDARFDSHLALASDGAAGGRTVPMAEHLAAEPQGWADQLPYLLMTGPDDVVDLVLVDRQLTRIAQRTLAAWHRLQELGGIHNSHVARELSRERAIWEEERARLTSEAAAPAAPLDPVLAAPAAGAAEAAAEELVAEEPERDPYQPWIETARCSTCNECTAINDQMFAYNDNMQAFIADADAGTYAQLVQAAENCQVAIIHPGKPRNPAEPGLEDLMKRAEPFA